MAGKDQSDDEQIVRELQALKAQIAAEETPERLLVLVRALEEALARSRPADPAADRDGEDPAGRH